MTNKDIWLNVNDVKQYSYCRRIPFYNNLIPQSGFATYSMKAGTAFENSLGRDLMLKLFDERITNSYRLVKDAKLESRKLMLRGKLDYALLGRTDAFPIEVKYGSTPIRYKSQLVSYSMLIEDGLDLKSTIGYFVYSYSLSRPKVYAVGITEEDKEQVRKELFNIRNDIKKGTRPEPTSLQEKCVFCEFRNFCDDVF